jgi:PAS domain S-box-containing protein
MRNQPPKSASAAHQSGSFEAAHKSKVLHTALLLTAISAIPIGVLYLFNNDPSFAGLLIGVSALSWVSLYLNRRGHSTRAAFIYLIVIYAAIFYAIIKRSALTNPGLIALPAWVLAVSYFFRKRAVFIACLILILSFVVICVLHQFGILTLSPPPTLEQLIIISFSLVVSGIVMWTSSGLHDYRVADLMASIVGGLGTAAETGRSNASLPESAEIENKFRHFAQATADAILLLNAEGVILFVNAAAGQILDVPSGKVLGRPLTSLLAEPDFSRLLEEINSVLNQQDEIQVHELPGFAKHQGGEEIPIKLAYSAWRSGADRFICVVIRDLTEQMETQKWLVFQERLGTLGSLVAGCPSR